MPRFASQDISSWKDFIKIISPQRPGWTYRGQPRDVVLRTSMERALCRWGISLRQAPAIEFQTIRDFRRQLQDAGHQQVHDDTLYCLALMQHYGAPTRLLDCTYSPFVAAAFAMQDGIFSDDRSRRAPVIWCFNGKWCEKEATKIAPNRLVEDRGTDKLRTDSNFRLLYKMRRCDLYKRTQSKFILHENPLKFNERLTIQQGVFLCPGDLGSSFEDNLTAMPNWRSKTSVLKLRLKLKRGEAVEFARNLKRMNLGFAALFPGLDGFARSIGQQLFHYRDMAEQRAGLPAATLHRTPSNASAIRASHKK